MFQNIVKKAGVAVAEHLRDLAEAIAFVIATGKVLVAAKADGGGINWKDAPKLFDLIGPAGVAADGAENILPSLGDATGDELQSIADYVNENLPESDHVDVETIQLAEGAAISVYLLARHLYQKGHGQTETPVADVPGVDPADGELVDA